MPKLIYPFQNYGSNPGIYVSQGFGGNPDMYAQFGMKGHNGWDFKCVTGTPIIAVHDGRIDFYQDGGYGVNLRLRFEEEGFEWECVYGHLQKYEGAERDVKRGDVIAYSDNTGYSTGPHLHFGIRKLLNGQVVDHNNGYLGYIDPGPLFRKETMRLVNDNGTYFLVGNKAKMGLNGIEALVFFRKLTSEEETGSTAGIPQLGVFENQLGIDLD